MKIMEEIFTGTMNRLMVSGILTPSVDKEQSKVKGKGLSKEGRLQRNYGTVNLSHRLMRMA